MYVGRHLVKDGDELTLGHLHFTVLETPGHTPGGSACTVKASSFPATRCSAIPSAVPTLRRLVEDAAPQSGNELMTLPDNTLVLPGHGPATSIGDERRGNPFLDGGW